MCIDERQLMDLDALLAYLGSFWRAQVDVRSSGRIAPESSKNAEERIKGEQLPAEPQPLRTLTEAIDNLIVPNVLKNSHPLFLGFVTPPSTDIGALGASISAILNQNVMFHRSSPMGTAIEEKVVGWLAELVGYGPTSGGILTNGGSAANLYGLAVARRNVIGADVNEMGNRADTRCPRIYCSRYSHHSIDKAAILMGMGKEAIRRVDCDRHHRVLISKLRETVATDSSRTDCRPIAIVANAGTRHACAFDDLEALRQIADEFELWLHVDAAYGGFLRLADNPPQELAALGKANSVAINPHKLLFVPYEAGAFLVRDKQALVNTFGTEGEYRTVEEPPGIDFADLGMQLGRGMEALKVWLTLKYFGTKLLGREYTRLMSLAAYLKEAIESDARLELLAPVAGTAVCFRWIGSSRSERYNDGINHRIRALLLKEGTAFIDDVTLDGKRGFRICLTNYRTQQPHLDSLLNRIRALGEELN